MLSELSETRELTHFAGGANLMRWPPIEYQPLNLLSREPQELTYVQVGTQMVPTGGFPGLLRSNDPDVQEQIEREQQEVDQLPRTMHPVLASAPSEEDDLFCWENFQ